VLKIQLDSYKIEADKNFYLTEFEKEL